MRKFFIVLGTEARAIVIAKSEASAYRKARAHFNMHGALYTTFRLAKRDDKGELVW